MLTQNMLPSPSPAIWQAMNNTRVNSRLHILKNSEIPINLNFKIYHIYVLPLVTYGLKAQWLKAMLTAHGHCLKYFW